MKRTRRILLAAGLMLSVGALLVAPHAEATSATTNTPAVASVSSSAHYTFVKGLDGNLWYTLSSSLGLTKADTGNATNPFDKSNLNFTSGGFVVPSSFCVSGTVVNSGATFGTCSGIWVKAPGAATLQSNPIASLFGPIAATTSEGIFVTGAYTARATFPFLPSSRAMLINIVAPGLDNNLWYTLFDGTGNAGSTVSMNGSSFGASASGAGSIAADDPFARAAEDSDSGWVSTTSLQTSCNSLAVPGRTCFGIWAPMP